jgi:cob(I)alamin adenosyltransferase
MAIFTTKSGDQGTTRLISGDRVSKAHPAVVATGELDTFRAMLAELRLMLLESPHAQHADFLNWLLHMCFVIGTQVNDPAGKKPEYRITDVSAGHVARIEEEQARLEATLQLPRAFIVSATGLLSARADVVATQARKLERSIVQLREAEPAFDSAQLLIFVNRISDYLCALARAVESGQHQPVDYRIITGQP